MNLEELKDIAISACILAGKFLCENKDSTKQVLSEEGRDIKLIIDQETEKLIRSHLEKTNINVLGEEYGGNIEKGK